ncbi:MAG TPA: beta-ketoacyl synthase N-terminal-like domain-containing protein [Planctomycetota bacterium]|nr:beta-ketoacyl synthase N-terminal-like domain-containing protein [Planctomycetota bacterium]
MKAPPVILAVGAVDESCITGTAGVHVRWSELGSSAPGTGRTFRAVFGRPDETFRRLDRVSRALVLASTAAGLDGLLSPEARAGCALVVETCLGCLDSDLRFAQSLGTGMCDGPVFPYTLPSTCLGEIALRHGLRGPSVCLSIAPEASGLALAEARNLLAAGDAEHALACTVDVLERMAPDTPATCRAVVALLARARADLAPVAPWPGPGADPWSRLTATLQHRTRTT